MIDGAPVSDADARGAIADDLDTTLVVEAAAGTGKTTELVNRIVRILATGRARMVEIVAVTFTEKAAGELKLRLREALERERSAAADAGVRRRLEHALETLEEAHVNTIHGFCAELLRERPVEAGVDPLFAVLSEPEADRLYARAFQSWFQTALEDPPPGLRRALRRTSAAPGEDADGPIDRLRAAGRALVDARDYPHPWRRPVFDREREIDRLVHEVHELADLTAAPLSARDNLYLDTEPVRRLSAQIRLERSYANIGEAADAWPAARPESPPAITRRSAPPDDDVLEARLIDLGRDRRLERPRKGFGHRYGTDRDGRQVARADVLARCEALHAHLQEFRRLADADLAALLQQELAGAADRYEALKRRAGALDYADLLARARQLIRGDAGVRRHLQQKYARIFVDEFQDTDPVQAEILLLLAADDPAADDPALVRPVPGKLFIVGDPKQAIYRFRGTDVGVYQRVRRQLEACGGRTIHLTTSYRSVPAIQRFVNAAFAEAMRPDGGALQPDYVPLAPYRASPAAQPAIVALPVPEPYGGSVSRTPSARAIEKSLPDAVGAFIAWITDPANGWEIAEPQPGGGERLVPLQPRHVAVLFRRFVSFGKDVTRPYVEAIEARGIPHLLVGGKAFHDREEVDTLRAALAAVEWPDDELSVFAALKGSLFAIDDEQLLEYRHRFGPFHPFRIPRELGGNSGGELELSSDPVPHLVPVADALRLLQQLHRGRNDRPVAETIGRLLAETRAHVGFALRPAGEQVLANVLHVAELARQYELGGGISFRGFIEELRTAAARDAREAPILEEGSDGVRLMTVHKAKGLEFPVVVLADLTCRLSRDEASRYLDASRGLCAIRIGGWAPDELHAHEAEEVARDRAEGVRVAYVAATRARDLLVVPALGDGPWEGGWTGPLNRALYPPPSSRRSPSRGPRCPAFRSKDSVLKRPNDEPASADTVAPGEYAFAGAGYSVVWWDPGALELGARPSFGVRREDLIVKDVPPHVVADGCDRYERWRKARAAARDAGGAPSLRVEPMRDWAARLTAVDEGAVGGLAAGEVALLRLDRAQSGDRGYGAAFGTLVHAVLAQAPFDADDTLLGRIAEVEARLLGLDAAEASAAAAVAARVWSHEILDRARAANRRGACRRETPVTWVAPDGTVLEGVVDLAFEEAGSWTVVDYKTDLEVAGAGEDRYRRQVALYGLAIAAATGTPSQAILFIV